MADLGGWHRRLIEGCANSFSQQALLFLLRLPAFFFSLLGRLRVACYRWRWLPVYRAPVPVISVGNLAVGGTGKTPVTDYLVKLLLARGLRVAVVSRGYGGAGVEGEGLVSRGGGPIVGPEAAGDEPYLLARRNPRALVLVNPRRRVAVAAAVRQGAEVVVLDDGFQHLAVVRDLDIVLLDAARPLGNGRVLPAGRLREPAAALKRADLLLLTRYCGGDLPVLPVEKPTLCCRHQLAAAAIDLKGEPRPLAELTGRRVVAVAGIADPQAFFAALTAHGMVLVATFPLPDHASYGQELRAQLSAAARQADCLVTTEKDGVKLTGADFPVPCYQLPLEIVFDAPERFAAMIENCLHGKEVA
ncbi:tetraacyldisaccharide 4'-kinase [Desulfuromonas carbonis]|uniref:tetraacyldisaccharide 4'-kinase n=1 Tax=Desulfuromonas sp. DDH964 TaxID=1823759 RepID=UPI00078B6C0E|nr:tetraacyldisaccharide 4'-kinase [Desulfuromonas sp. DDH964]AMV72670.1 tetraacyldisaccharide-1-phosphate 4'-kinase [Desulfuromonas sp. DDH964]